MADQNLMDESEVGIYRQLQQHLDTLPVGYPPAESGVDLRLLKQVFTPEEAKIASNLKYAYFNDLESLDSIQLRFKSLGFKYTEEQLENHLDNMAQKGAIMTLKVDNQKTYGNAMFIIGIFEYQVNKLTKQFAEDTDQYFKEAFMMGTGKIPSPAQLRTIPVGITIDHEVQIASFDDVKKIIENVEGPLGLINCVCRQAKEEIGHTCKTTSRKETCMGFGPMAQMYNDMGWGREISREEAIEILRKNEEDGLVIQPGNAQKTDFICSCCSCCCEGLSNIKLLPNPADVIPTNHYAEIDSDLCIGCGTCVDRCPMEAITLDDDISSISRLRCIGCGNCISVCDSGALSLTKKEKQEVPAETMTDLYHNIATVKTEYLEREQRKKERREKWGRT
ncbi:MAG: 4Fe-4S binding protein [Candidatus Lokiarchaeota archaeon]|nr:4Fe-4S binding protein [Candidatus Lokiarchaeota archaeon]